MLSGIDVSNLQAAIDWPRVPAEVEVVMVKATEGVGYADAWAPANAKGVRGSGRLVGWYHFARPDLDDPEAEADWCIERLRPLWQPGDPVALDLEVGTGELAGWALRWLRRVRAALGIAPLLYASPAFLVTHGLTDPALAEYGLWLAQWWTPRAPAPVPDAPVPWPFVALWQWTEDGRVPGIEGAVDCNLFFGDRAAWARYGTPAPAGWVVGPGLRAALSAAGEAPVSHEQFVTTAQGEFSRVLTEHAVWEYQADPGSGVERIYRAGQRWLPPH